MNRRTHVAALTGLLVLSAPAAAQPASFGPAAAPLRTARLFDNAPRGISVARSYGVEPDGIADTRRGIVGQAKVADNVDVGIGLFSIIRDSRERRLGRADPMRDTGGRSRSVVAAGVTLRF